MNLLAALVVVTNLGFTAGYDTDAHTPRWVAYDLEPRMVVKAPRADLAFRPDPAVPDSDPTPLYSTCFEFDKGHLCPAADMNWDTNALRQTYYYTNVCPQHPRTNRGAWLATEREVRSLAQSGTVHVVIVPLDFIYLESLGPRYCVPTRFVKVAYGSFGAKVWEVGNDR